MNDALKDYYNFQTSKDILWVMKCQKKSAVFDLNPKLLQKKNLLNLSLKLLDNSAKKSTTHTTYRIFIITH